MFMGINLPIVRSFQVGQRSLGLDKQVVRLAKVSVGEWNLNIEKMTAVKRVELEFNLTYFELSLC